MNHLSTLPDTGEQARRVLLPGAPDRLFLDVRAGPFDGDPAVAAAAGLVRDRDPGPRRAQRGGG